MPKEKIIVTSIIQVKVTEEYEVPTDAEDFLDEVYKVIEEKHPGSHFGVLEVKDQFGKSLWE